MAPEVQVELFIGGKGPEHVFKAALGGWDENRLDLEQIMSDYKLRAVYAFSVGHGRGQRLLYNPRNGLSIVPYSGKSDSVIRLDGDPKSSLMMPILKMVGGVGFIVAMGAFFITGIPNEWIDTLRNATGGRLMWFICFLTMIFLQLTRRRSKRRV